MLSKMDKKLIELREKIKSKKPDFIRQDAYKKKRLCKKWRKPKGKHSKMRLHRKGHRKSVSPGYSSPNVVKGFHPTGLKGILVSSIKDLEVIKPETEGAVISKTTGTKKRVGIVLRAKEKGINILNIKDLAKYLENIEIMQKERKEAKIKREEKKTKKKKEAEKKSEQKKKEKLAEKISEEEKKEQEKKEKDKLLIKKEV